MARSVIRVMLMAVTATAALFASADGQIVRRPAITARQNWGGVSIGIAQFADAPYQCDPKMRARPISTYPPQQ